MSGWNIVSQMMHRIAFFLSNQKRVINMNLPLKLDTVIRKMQLKGSETMLVVLIVSTTILDCILMILITKDSIDTVMSNLVVRLKNSKICFTSSLACTRFFLCKA
jgi:hypothetical protein